MIPKTRTLLLGIGGAVVSGLMVLALGIWLGLGTGSVQAQSPSETGRIAIFKTVCDDIGRQNTCHGRDTSQDGDDVQFEVIDTEGNLVVTLGENANGEGNVGNGSQGRIVSEPLPIGTYTVCEVDPNFTSVPRPPAGDGGSTGGTNQTTTTVDGNGCIVVDITAGTAELKFLNQVVTPTATATPPAEVTPTATPVTATPTATPVTPGEVTPTPGPGEVQPTATPTAVPAAAVVAPTSTPVVSVLPAVATAAPTPAVLVLPAAGSGGLANAGLPLSLIAVNGLALAGLGLAALAGWRRRQ